MRTSNRSSMDDDRSHPVAPASEGGLRNPALDAAVRVGDRMDGAWLALSALLVAVFVLASAIASLSVDGGVFGFVTGDSQDSWQQRLALGGSAMTGVPPMLAIASLLLERERRRWVALLALTLWVVAHVLIAYAQQDAAAGFSTH
ncbi:MAG: hypothetical protein JWM98_2959 [Thermoleophilia bacterium]|nr:hypothetical protein [Thermoleophilia bacterium]